MSTYRLARGVRLQHGPNGEGTLLVPEGIVELNDSALATLELVDGTRDARSIAALLSERYESDPTEMAADVAELLTALAERGFIVA